MKIRMNKMVYKKKKKEGRMIGKVGCKKINYIFASYGSKEIAKATIGTGKID